MTDKIQIICDFIIRKYNNYIKAAIAYNKAIDLLFENSFSINYQKNYIDSLDTKEYLELYDQIKISKKLRALVP